MSSLEERVAYLEGRLEDHTSAVGRLHTSIDDLHQETRRGFEQVQHQFGQVQHQFEQVQHRFEQVQHQFERVDARFIGLDQKVDRHFTWLVGIQMAVLVSVVGALVSSYFR
jgi:hypothetical protein